MQGRKVICPDVGQLCARMAREITDHLNAWAVNRDAYVALSGGSTPVPFFQELAARKHDRRYGTLWSRVHFFWVDERCVPPSHADSNYRTAREYLFVKAGIDEKHVHRIRGEKEPASEAVRYEAEVRRMVPAADNRPSFDWILLGLGKDGHTASVFPDRMDLNGSDRLYINVVHPQTRQPRITMTPLLINNASRISFLVTGTSKHAILKKLVGEQPEPAVYPAGLVRPVHGNLEWWMDEDASNDLW